MFLGVLCVIISSQPKWPWLSTRGINKKKKKKMKKEKKMPTMYILVCVSPEMHSVTIYYSCCGRLGSSKGMCPCFFISLFSYSAVWYRKCLFLLSIFGKNTEGLWSDYKLKKKDKTQQKKKNCLHFRWRRAERLCRSFKYVNQDT